MCFGEPAWLRAIALLHNDCFTTVAQSITISFKGFANYL
jgi:hypothetical protein